MCDAAVVAQCVYRRKSRRVKENLQGGGRVKSTNVQILLFADNIVMVTEKSNMHRNLDEVKKVVDNWRLKMHWWKIELMMVSRTEEECNMSIEGKDSEHIKKLQYLGARIGTDGKSDEEIEQ